MGKDYSLADWHRILIGETPWTFLIEVVIRAGLTYVLIMLAMRLLGRRVASQYTLFELSVVVTLAGAIGVPLQAQERGMLPPLIIMAAVIIFQRVAARLSMKHSKVDGIVSGKVMTALDNGRLHLDVLRQTVLSREKIFSLLRMRNVQHLGQLSRVYIEPSGSLSVVWTDQPCPGLPIIPETDQELREAAASNDHYACSSCGHTVKAKEKPDSPCDFCQSTLWIRAAVELED
ncbi:uncharacterized protein DUF421 [Pseudomonas duriflava]|uniref:Uncharacterized protein DUF421 n=1 Tax=Pseudomonas duriflava TaxID=459528 RepID=A0A562Q2K9_9PSED|nr:YetF domain-containing protein [Pseudomonas duriflava]TWI50931.1 uncharacterized protein DUF421 [Pseudomonas duriflava]